MSCFSCMGCRRKDVINIEDRIEIQSTSQYSYHSTESGRGKHGYDTSEYAGMRKSSSSFNGRSIGSNIEKYGAAQRFTFRELAFATKNFKLTNLIGEGGFGKVYKGLLESGQASFSLMHFLVVAVKQLDQNSIQGNKEFIVEVLMLSLLHHPNLVTLLGYCADGDQRLLVYEYMPMGSVEDHLFGLDHEKKPLDWNTRINIALGAAQGLKYLHCQANPPVIYRDLKSANILLDNNFEPKLSDFGLAKLGPVGGNTHVSTRVMGTYGYCAPEYAMSGKLTLKSDIYSFGVLLLELITGRKAMDFTKKHGEQSIIAWGLVRQPVKPITRASMDVEILWYYLSRPFLKEKKMYVQLVDPLLNGHFPVRSLHQAIAITAMCLQEQPNFRPIASDIVVALEYVASQPYSERRSEKSSPPLSSPTPQEGGDLSQ
ncbi:hypothetical protein IFM89_037159 [Coptis chinensis]|uniref:non-specific serine/threonine protein kinase n=1 Tax=Coptis chinensis TaxID=261450 RepID=A0A835I7D0_9MAGN|nr:hypothetical protein IFM89_037159 [Coptis chinensis]